MQIRNNCLLSGKEKNMVDKRILVVMGGTSSEKEVSMRSGEAMYKAVCEKGYNAEKFVLTSSNAGDIIAIKPDCVLLALHGKGGEDGCIQGMLELAGIPYTGSGVASSAACMNKIFTKKIIAFEGIRTSKFISIGINEEFSYEQLKDRVLQEIGLPAVIKAPCQGSSVGVKIARSADSLSSILEEIYQLDHELLIEKYLPGKEITIPVIKKGKNISTLPIIEITSENSFYDYESKYTVGMSHHIIPAQISKDNEEIIKQMAIDTYKALNCSGLVRVDFMLDSNELPYVMEVNTLPGMTETSLVPDAARACGIEFNELVSLLIEDALAGDYK